MEPADDRRDDRDRLLHGVDLVSDAAMEPPVTGGTTERHLHRAGRAMGAAMEPAADRRGYEAKKLTAYTDDSAAMEPAGYRREYVQPIPAGDEPDCEPQWSPPVIGGNTGQLDPQELAGRATAMEPADDRRDDGSRFRSRVTCANPRCREQLPGKATPGFTRWSCQGANSAADLLASARGRVSPPERSHGQTMTAADVGSFSCWPRNRNQDKYQARPRLMTMTLSARI